MAHSIQVDSRILHLQPGARSSYLTCQRLILYNGQERRHQISVPQSQEYRPKEEVEAVKESKDIKTRRKRLLFKSSRLSFNRGATAREWYTCLPQSEFNQALLSWAGPDSETTGSELGFSTVNGQDRRVARACEVGDRDACQPTRRPNG